MRSAVLQYVNSRSAMARNVFALVSLGGLHFDRTLSVTAHH